VPQQIPERNLEVVGEHASLLEYLAVGGMESWITGTILFVPKRFNPKRIFALRYYSYLNATTGFAVATRTV
jgi:hypothetical protein